MVNISDMRESDTGQIWTPVFLNETPESVLGNIHQQLLLV